MHNNTACAYGSKNAPQFDAVES